MALTKIGPSLGGSADIINVTQTSHTFVSNDRGKAVRMNNNSGTPQYVFARANTTANADALGIIIHVIDGNNFTMATSGRITVDYCVPNEVAGTVLFLSEITAGVLTSTEPSGNNEVSKPMAVITIANSEMIMLQQRGEVISTAGISIADDAVTTAKIADDAVTSAKIAAGTIVGVDIADGVITAQKLASGSVGTSQLANNQVTGDKIALGSDAQGDVMYYNGTDWVRLGFGTSGHFLKTQGTGANPLWAAAGGALSTKRVYTSYTQGTTSDPQTISGAGFQPTKVEIIASTANTGGGSSIGHSDSSNSEFCTSLQSNGYYGARDGSIVHISNGSWSLSCTCTINSDGCSLDWATGGSGWDTVQLSVMFSR